MLQVTRQGQLQTTELFLELCGFARNQFRRWKQDHVYPGMFCSSKLRSFQGMFFCWMPKVSSYLPGFLCNFSFFCVYLRRVMQVSFPN